MAGGQIQWGMSFKVDKTGLNDLKTELLSIQKLTTADYARGKHAQVGELAQELKQVKQSALEVQTALEKSFNTNLGTLNVVKFNQELKRLDINRIAADLNKAGASGQSAFRNLVTQTLTTNLQLKETHKLLDSIATSMGNTIKWGVTSSIFNTMTNSVERAWSFSKQLDTSLNSIRIVTGKSADEMERFAKQANKASQTLGRSTRDYTDASLIYYQQGLADDEVRARTETTLKAANVTGQSGQEVSEQLTAVWNGYKVSAQETESYVDKLAAVAASTASDLEELSTGISRVAAAANTAGVDIDELTAQVATIVSVTREAPETVGNSLKTMFARFGDLKVDGVDEFGVTLGKVSGQLQDVGIQILDESGNMREMGDIITDLAEKWQTWTSGQKQAVAVAVAGKMQYSRLMTLMENWDMYREALQTSQNSMGTLQEQQDIYMESTEAHLQQLSTAWERVWNAMGDSKSTNNLIDVLTGLVTTMANFTEAIGGGGNALLTLGSIGTQVFSRQIAQGLSTTITNIQNARENTRTLNAEMELLEQFKGIPVLDSVSQELINMKQQILELNNVASTEDRNQANAFITRRNDLENESVNWEARKTQAQDFYQQQTGQNLNLSGIQKGDVNYTQYIEDLKEIEDQYKNIKKDAASFSSELVKLNDAAEEFDTLDSDENLDKYGKALKDASLSIEGYTNDVKDMIDNDMTSSDTKKRLANALTIYQQALKEAGEEGLENADVQNAANDLVDEYVRAGQEIRNQAQQTRTVLTEESAGASQRIRSDIQTIQDEYDRFIAKLKQTQMITGFVEMASGLGQIVSGFNAIKNIGNIFSDETLSSGEKVLQIMMALTTAIPMLINGYTLLSGALPKVALGMGALKAGTDLTSVGFLQAAGAVLTFQTALGPLWLVLLAIAAVAGAVVGITYGLVKAYNADADAAKAAAEASQQAADAALEAKEAYEELLEAFDGYDTAVEKLNELEEGTNEYKDALIEANQAAMELIENNKSLATKATRNAQGLIEFRDENGEIIDRDQLIQEARTRMNTSEAAANLSQADANTASLKSQRTNFIRENEMDWWWDLKAFFTEDAINDDQLQQILDIINTTGGITADDLENIVGSNQSLIDTLLETDNKEELMQLAKTTEELNATNKLLIDENLRNGLENDETYANMSESEKNAVASIYGGELTQEEQDKLKNELHDRWYGDFAFGWGNEDDVHKRYAELMGWTMTADHWGDTADFVDSEGNEHKDISDDSMRAYIVNYELSEQLAKYNPENLQKIEAAIQGISKVGNAIDEVANSEMLGFAGGQDTDFDEEKITLGMRQQILDSITSGEMLKNLSDVTDEQWKSIGYENAQAYIDAIQNGLSEENFDVVASRAASMKRLGGASDSAASLIQSIQSGDVTYENADDNEDYTAVIKQLNELKEIYPDVAAAAGMLEEKWLIGTQEYMEALEQVQDKLYQAKITSLTDDANQKIDEITELVEDNSDIYGPHTVHLELNADDEEFQDKMDDILNAEYAIDVAIHAEAEQEFDSISNALNDISEKAAMIGENFVVSANDVRELNNTFPGIIQNMRDLGDGTVQLNQEVVQSAIGMAQAEVAADSQATIAKLRNQASLLREKQAIYQNMANAALILAQTEVEDEQTASEQRAIISEDLAKLKGINDELQTQQEMDNDQSVADSSYTNGEITAKNWASAYQSAANSSYQFAQTAVANMQAAANGGTPVAPGDFGVSYSGSTGQSSEAKVLEGTQNALDNASNTSQGQWAELAQKYQMLADSAGAAANDIDGMIAQIGASNVENLNKFNNIKSGNGTGDKSGSKEKDPDYMDELEDEADRYHDIDIILKQIDTDLGRLEKQEDKLFGKDLIENLNQQLQKLDDQIDATNQKIVIAQGEAAELRGELSGYGVTFNADGTIANYAQVYQAQLNYVNSLIREYNAMSAEEQEKFKDVVENAKENFDKFTQSIDDYDKLISDTIPGLEDDIQDAINKEIELKIEEFNMEIEIRLDLAEAERDWNEFKKKVIDGIKDDDILGNTRARLQDFYSYYKSDGTGEVQATYQHVNDILGQLNQMDQTGTSDWYGDNRKQALEDLKSYNDELMRQLEDIEDLVQEIKDSYLDMMDKAADKFGDQVALYEQVKDIIDHDMNVIELVYGEDSYEDLARYYKQQEDNYNQMVDFQRQQKDFWYNQMKAIEDAGRKNSEAWLKAKENWMDAVNDWNSTIEDAIENLQDKYLNAINLIFQQLNDKVTSGKGLEYTAEEWELINKNADQYLDTINSLYGIQDLENKYLDAIDNTDSISAQRKLNDLMNEELAALREKDKLTEYDVERANRKYEIALKEIALEEAQQNKSTMRLRRDSQGNYTYQYVTDDDQIGQLQDELAALKNDLYNFDLEHYRDNLDQIYDIWEEFQEKMAEAAMINDPEERQERELLLREQYGELINGLVEQNEDIRLNLHESAFTELADLYNTDYANFQALSDEERDILLSQMIPQWDSGVQHMADVFAGEGGFVPTVQESMNTLDDTTKQYQTDLEELQSAAGQDFDSIREGIDETITQTQDLILNNGDLIRSYEEELLVLGNVIQQLQALQLQYEATKNEAIAAAEAANAYWQTVNRQAANDAKNNVTSGGSGSGSGTNSNNTASNSSGSGSGGSGSGSGGATVGNKITYSGKYYYDSFGTSPVGSKYAGVADGVVIDIVNNNPYGIHIKSSDGKYPDLGWIKKSQVTRWNTGGYTGDWGNDSGRLAILDRKELVLDKDDTNNVLNMVKISRGLMTSMNTAMIERIANNMRGIAETAPAAANSDTLEQNVHIEASFPDVKTASEIEQALNNIVNIAAQRAMRRGR